MAHALIIGENKNAVWEMLNVDIEYFITSTTSYPELTIWAVSIL